MQTIDALPSLIGATMGNAQLLTDYKSLRNLGKGQTPVVVVAPAPSKIAHDIIEAVEEDINADLEDFMPENTAGINAARMIVRLLANHTALAFYEARRPVPTIVASVHESGLVEIVIRHPGRKGRLALFVSPDGLQIQVVSVDANGETTSSIIRL